ncbi:MAG: DNA replication/repair protein RecF [Actinomycetes bacterium]
MQLEHLWLTDFRSYASVDLELPSGLTAFLGPNGQGKSNLLEAVAYLATLESFRGAPAEALVRRGAQTAVVRGEVRSADRAQLIETEINLVGRNRVLVNRQRLQRTRDLLDALRVTVFAPDDLELLKGGPQVRRSYLDRALVLERPAADSVRSDFEKALRQRNALLKQCKGRLDEAATLTLEVWDEKLAQAGEELTRLRVDLAARLGPVVTQAYQDVAGAAVPVSLDYVSDWRDLGLAAALHESRPNDVRRGTTLVGPHRDDLQILLDEMPSRTHSSQGEQRSLALGLRLGVHRLVTERTGVPPVLLLDDVFSELDPTRSAALLAALPAGQTLLSAATGLPPGAAADLVLYVSAGTVTPA